MWSLNLDQDYGSWFRQENEALFEQWIPLLAYFIGI